MDGALVILFQAAFSLAVYCVAEALCKTVICMDGMLAIFLLTAFASAAYCAAGAHQKTTVCIDGTLANFSILLSDSLGTVRPFCFEKMWSAWAELSPFFLQTTCGLLLRFHYTQRSRDILLWFLIQMVPFWRHFEVILESFWSPKWSNGPILTSWDQSGINLGSRGSSCAKLHRLGPSVFGPFLDQFSTSFVFAWKNVKFGVQILVIVFWMIFERFWSDFEVTFGGQKWSKV
jgi:hypothetical protein